MFTHDFVRNAYLAGTAIGLGCGLIGWFVVLRGQLFAGDALSHVAFVGAIAAAVLGVDERVGLFALTRRDGHRHGGTRSPLAGRRHSDRTRCSPGSSASGCCFCPGWPRVRPAAVAISAANALFGSIYSLGAGASRVAALIAVGVGVATLLALRPLLLASLDAELAVVRGVPVRALGAGFLIALALLTADGTQAIGALLLLGLLSAPAGAAHQLTADPRRGVALSALLAVGCVWAGLALSYAIASVPPSSAIIGLAGGAYAIAAITGRVRRRRAGRRESGSRQTGPGRGQRGSATRVRHQAAATGTTATQAARRTPKVGIPHIRLEVSGGRRGSAAHEQARACLAGGDELRVGANRGREHGAAGEVRVGHVEAVLAHAGHELRDRRV